LNPLRHSFLIVPNPLYPLLSTPPQSLKRSRFTRHLWLSPPNSTHKPMSPSLSLTLCISVSISFGTLVWVGSRKKNVSGGGYRAVSVGNSNWRPLVTFNVVGQKVSFTSARLQQQWQCPAQISMICLLKNTTRTTRTFQPGASAAKRSRHGIKSEHFSGFPSVFIRYSHDYKGIFFHGHCLFTYTVQIETFLWTLHTHTT